MAYNDKLQVIKQVEKALDDILFGSVELFLQDGEVTQITVKQIQKTGVKYGVAKHNSKKTSNFNGKSNVNAKLGLDNNL